MCKKAINNYGFDEVYESTKISFQKYYKGTKESLESVVDYIFRICAIRKKQTEIPYYKKFQYLKAVINNRAGYQKRNYYLFPVLEKIIKHLYENSIDELEEFEKTVKILNTFTDYEEYFNYLRGEYGI